MFWWSQDSKSFRWDQCQLVLDLSKQEIWYLLEKQTAEWGKTNSENPPRPGLAEPGEPWTGHSPLFQPCLWKSAQTWAGNRAEISFLIHVINWTQCKDWGWLTKTKPRTLGHWRRGGKKWSNSAYKAQQSKWCRKVISLHLIVWYESGKPFFYPNMETECQHFEV